MMGLKDIGHTLPPGFRFYPSDEELICHYLYRKIIASEQADVIKDTLMDIDLHACEPWQLPDVAKLNSNEWYFFSFRDRKYATGFRTNRATASGYWKATGKDRVVLYPSTRAVVGMRKTLVFYKNRAPNGIKTGWIMHEFRQQNPYVPPKEDWVLCRVFHKPTSDNTNINHLGPNYNLYDNSTSNLAFTSELPYAIPSNYRSHNQRYHRCESHHEIDYHPSLSAPEHSLASNDPNYTKLLAADQTKCANDYGFLFDMNFDCSDNGVSSNNDMEI